MSVLVGGVAGASSRLSGGLLTSPPRMVSDVQPMVIDRAQRPSRRVEKIWQVYGLTKNSAGALLPGCTVDLFRTSDNLLMGTCVSDASAAYSISTNVDGPFYVVAYLAGSPDVAGTTVNSLIGF